MTTFSAIPDEVLLMIFGALSPSDLHQCQKVCKSLYSTAHVQLLKEVNLNDPHQIEQFITSFESNPNPLYFKAVKSLIFDLQDSSSPDYVLDNNVINKLFLQFTNLSKVELLGSLALFNGSDDDICRSILKSCPKLDKFEVYSSDDDQEYFTALFEKTRLISTMIEVEEREYLPIAGHSFLQYISAFPRL